MADVETLTADLREVLRSGVYRLRLGKLKMLPSCVAVGGSATRPASANRLREGLGDVLERVSGDDRDDLESLRAYFGYGDYHGSSLRVREEAAGARRSPPVGHWAIRRRWRDELLGQMALDVLAYEEVEPFTVEGTINALPGAVRRIAEAPSQFLKNEDYECHYRYDRNLKLVAASYVRTIRPTRSGIEHIPLTTYFDSKQIQAQTRVLTGGRVVYSVRHPNRDAVIDVVKLTRRTVAGQRLTLAVERDISESGNAGRLEHVFVAVRSTANTAHKLKVRVEFDAANIPPDIRSGYAPRDDFPYDPEYQEQLIADGAHAVYEPDRTALRPGYSYGIWWPNPQEPVAASADST